MATKRRRTSDYTLKVLAGEEDGRPVAEPRVVALAIASCRVVHLEEELEQLAIAELGWIENDLDGFGVSAVVAIGLRSARWPSGGGRTKLTYASASGIYDIRTIPGLLGQ